MQEDILDDAFELSDKSYALAVCLSGIFGVLGIHHFYLERWAMGFFDLGLSITGILLLSNGSYWGILVLGIDFLHTIYVTYKLSVGEYADGLDRIVSYPGQKNFQHSKKI